MSWRNFCNVHPPFHGLRIPLDTHHVQMIFFTPLHGVQTPFPSHSIPHPNHSFPLSCHSYVCIPHKLFLHFMELLQNGSLPRSPHKMFLHFMLGLQCRNGLIADYIGRSSHVNQTLTKHKPLSADVHPQCLVSMSP